MQNRNILSTVLFLNVMTEQTPEQIRAAKEQKRLKDELKKTQEQTTQHKVQKQIHQTPTHQNYPHTQGSHNSRRPR